MNNDSLKKHSLFSVFGILFAIIIVGYSAFQAKNLVLGPQVTITEPRNGSSVPHEIVTIRGEARNISAISLNDSPIFITNTGLFEEKLIAPPGYSIMTLRASDRFGRSITRYIHLMNTEERSIPSPTIMPTGTSTEEDSSSNNQT